jgi:LPXTG-site transpeptidase (sortase) family protein
MGDGPRFLKNRERVRLYGFIAIAFLAFLGALILGMSVLGINLLGTDGLVGRVVAPATPDSAEQAQRAAQEEAAYVARAKQAAAEQAAKNAVAAERHASNRRAGDKPVPIPVVPADTTMYLTIPAIGLTDIPVLEGTSEGVLSQGVGHVAGTGYPWVEGSNTYIAGHRLGYPGTISDHVFWQLPSLGAGDEIILEDSVGQSYKYQVSEILEVSPTDLSVTGSTGRDMVSLQTCIENYGDYWTPGPNWLTRYIVRADRVG